MALAVLILALTAPQINFLSFPFFVFVTRAFVAAPLFGCDKDKSRHDSGNNIIPIS
jgi:hypothetical protein